MTTFGSRKYRFSYLPWSDSGSNFSGKPDKKSFHSRESHYSRFFLENSSFLFCSGQFYFCQHTHHTTEEMSPISLFPGFAGHSG